MQTMLYMFSFKPKQLFVHNLEAAIYRFFFPPIFKTPNKQLHSPAESGKRLGIIFFEWEMNITFGAGLNHLNPVTRVCLIND